MIVALATAIAFLMVACDDGSGGNRFVAVGKIGSIAYSSDGARWTSVPSTNNGGFTGTSHISGFGNNRYVAVGSYPHSMVVRSGIIEQPEIVAFAALISDAIAARDNSCYH